MGEAYAWLWWGWRWSQALLRAPHMRTALHKHSQSYLSVSIDLQRQATPFPTQQPLTDKCHGPDVPRSRTWGFRPATRDPVEDEPHALACA